MQSLAYCYEHMTVNIIFLGLILEIISVIFPSLLPLLLYMYSNLLISNMLN